MQVQKLTGPPLADAEHRLKMLGGALAGLPLLSHHLLEHLLVEGEVGDQALEPRIFLLKLA